MDWLSPAMMDENTEVQSVIQFEINFWKLYLFIFDMSVTDSFKTDSTDSI